MMRNRLQWKNLLCAAAVCALGACGDDDDGDDLLTPDAGDGGTTLLDSSVPNEMDATVQADGGTPPQADPNARYAVAMQVSVGGAGGTSSTFVAVTNTLSSATQLTTNGAKKNVTGRALLASDPTTGSLFVSTGGAPEITKYTLDAADNLVTGPNDTINFQPQGVGTIGEYASQIQIVSATKAYLFDTRTAQVIVWNPSTMTFVKAIDIKALQVADATLTFSSALPVKRDGKIVLGAGWRTSNNQQAIKKVALVVLDTNTDTATILNDDRCAYVRDAVLHTDGRVYLATEAWASAVHRLNSEFAPPPCLLRTNAELTAFDTTFYKELNAIGGGVTGSLTQSRDGKVYTRVLDESAAGINAMTSARGLASLPTWSWAEVQLGDDPTAAKVPGQPLGSGSLVVFDTKAGRYVADIKMSTTELIDITRGIGGATLTTQGLTFSGAQVR